MSPEREYTFTLPYGYTDDDGTTHRRGRMRLATALDEIESVAHPRVQANEAYLPLVLLSRVITQLGELPQITPQVLEEFYATDVAYLEDLYLRLNMYDGMIVGARCPHCDAELRLKVGLAQEQET